MVVCVLGRRRQVANEEERGDESPHQGVIPTAQRIQPANVVVVPPNLGVDMLHSGGGNKKRMVTSDIITFREKAEIRIKFL